MGPFSRLKIPGRNQKGYTPWGLHVKVGRFLRLGKRMSLFYLPPEIVQLIADHLSAEDLISLRQCSRNLYELTKRAYYRSMAHYDVGDGLTGITAAASRNLISKMELIVSAGADVDVQDTCGNTALHAASARGDVHILRILLSATSNVSPHTDRRDTPLHIAALNGHLDCVELLVEAGADTSAPNCVGEFPIDMAGHARGDSIVYFLRTRGPALLYPCANGRTSLHEAVELGLCTEVKRFLRRRSYGTVDCRDDEGDTPLHIAARFGLAKIADILLEAGADVTAPNRDGCTPLHCPSRHSFEVVRTLLLWNARVDYRNNWGLTPMLSVCLPAASPEMVMLFIMAGADVNATADDRCLLQKLDSERDRDIIIILKAAGCRCEEHNHDIH